MVGGTPAVVLFDLPSSAIVDFGSRRLDFWVIEFLRKE